MLGSTRGKKHTIKSVIPHTHTDKPLSTRHVSHCNRCTWWRVWWANRIKSHHVFSVWLKSQRYHSLFFLLFLPHVCLYSMIRHTHCTTANPFIVCIALHFRFCFPIRRSVFCRSLFVFVNGRKNMRKMWMVNDERARARCVCARAIRTIITLTH